jgi:16S rRNA (cytidine1402-2'-O)-methyltransferase
MVSGTLYLVATPIGNLGDITLRAIDTLRQVDFVACEDTRHTGQLLAHLAIKKPLLRCDDHTEKRVAAGIATRMAEGESCALVTDAGTPGVSDPGYAVIQAALERELPIVPIPGPSAVTAALSASGLSTHAFRFAGFLPERQGPRQKRLAALADDDATQIFFVPPHKLRRWVPDLIEAWGDRPACLAREVTKKFEEFQRGRLSDIAAAYKEKTPRGEMVLLVAGKSE